MSQPARRSARSRMRSNQDPTGRRLILVPALLALGAVAAGFVLLRPGAAPLADPARTAGAGAATSRAALPALGAGGARVVLQEYGDYQCTTCAYFFRQIEPTIRAAYVETGKVQMVWHDFPWIGQESRDAANAARCAADQGQFWAYHDLLYANQQGENAGAFALNRLKAFGTQLGLDAALFDACVEADGHAGDVSADLADAARRGFPGTPTFIIGDTRIVGAQPVEVFAKALDAAIAAK